MKNGTCHLLVLVSVLALLAGGALADDDSDHERAREALESGEVVPLATILDRVESQYHGSVIEVELEDEEDEGEEDAVSGFIYEINLLTPQGNLLKIKFDARTGELIQVKGHGEKLARKKTKAPEEEREP